jgi:hypothetical protein
MEINILIYFGGRMKELIVFVNLKLFIFRLDLCGLIFFLSLLLQFVYLVEVYLFCSRKLLPLLRFRGIRIFLFLLAASLFGLGEALVYSILDLNVLSLHVVKHALEVSFIFCYPLLLLLDVFMKVVGLSSLRIKFLNARKPFFEVNKGLLGVFHAFKI